MHSDPCNALLCGAKSALHSRRDMVGGLAAIGGLLALPSGLAGRPLQRTARGVIDVHHHLVSPGWVAAKGAAYGAVTPTRLQAIQWTPAQSIAAMDKAGVDRAMLSLSAPGVWFGQVEEARRLSREVNDYAASVCAAKPERFGFFASVPLPDREGCIVEIDHALGTLKADGIALLTNYDNVYLGDARFRLVLEHLDRRSAVVFVHPTSNSCCASVMPGVSVSALEYPFDTVRAIASLLFAGVFHDFPRIRWIFSHGGGGVSMFVDRLQRQMTQKDTLKRFAPDGVARVLSRLYYDTASITNRPALNGIIGLASSRQILFGSDFPYYTIEDQLAEIGSNARNSALMIGSSNASELFRHRSG